MPIKFYAALLIAIIGFGTSMKQKKKIIFFGDSITQAGVKSDGYITKLHQQVLTKYPGNTDSFIGAGIGGNKVYDLYLRMEEDVLAKHPDAVVIWVGVNDVWHKKLTRTGTDANKFEAFYKALIKKMKAKKIMVYLCTPATIGEKTDGTNEMDSELDAYAAIIRTIASETNCPLLDLRKDFLDYLKKNNPDNKSQGLLTSDGVHLNVEGNNFVAQKMLVLLHDFLLK